MLTTSDSSVATPRGHAATCVRILLLLAAGALAGCGQKGALFLPGEPPSAATTMSDTSFPAPLPVPRPAAGAASAPVRP